MINIDTDTLKECSSAASNATAQLNDAANIIMQITTHNDWVCANKDKINGYITTNRQFMMQLVQDAKSFDNAIQQVTDSFVEEESKIGSMFEEIEELLAGVLNVNTISTGTIASIGSNFVSQAANAISSISVAAGDLITSTMSGEGE